MDSAPGTYVVVYHSRQSQQITIGQWSTLQLQAGYYFYVGSAFGPGGINARVSRHWRREKSQRWHVDYLSAYCEAVGAWYSHAPQRLEHQWAQALHGITAMRVIEGFGCSDCDCVTHLFYAKSNVRLGRCKIFRTSQLLWQSAANPPDRLR